MKSFKYCENKLNVTQRHELSTHCWKIGANRLVGLRVATNCQFIKHTISEKHNKQRYAYVWLFLYLLFPLMYGMYFFVYSFTVILLFCVSCVFLLLICTVHSLSFSLIFSRKLVILSSWLSRMFMPVQFIGH